MRPFFLVEEHAVRLPPPESSEGLTFGGPITCTCAGKTLLPKLTPPMEPRPVDARHHRPAHGTTDVQGL
mgnify:CR=1 FL=1